MSNSTRQSLGDVASITTEGSESQRLDDVLGVSDVRRDRENELTRRQRWSRASPSRPYFTRHALDRYDQRTPPGSVSPERAWSEGVDGWLVTHAPSFIDKYGNKPDQIRYYWGRTDRDESYRVILIARDGLLRSAYKWEFIKHSEVKSFLDARWEHVKGYHP